MNNRNVNELTSDQSCLLNIYDRLAALGRAMRKSAPTPIGSQAQHSTVANIQADGTIKQDSSPGIGQRQA